jgi:hypothetical protein
MPYKEKVKFLKPLFEDNSKKISYRDFTKEQKEQIQKTNNYFFYKLDKTTSCLNSQKWEKDFQRSRQFIKNICEFPNLNFQKTGQIKLEREKSFNEKKYSNTTINFYNNKFNKTNFKKTYIYKPEKKDNQNDINNEHFSGGETIEKDENKEINLIFIYKEKRFNVKCKTKDFFIEVIDKFCSDYNVDNGEIEEYVKKGETDGKEYIDRCDSLENNNLKNNDEIIAVARKKK